MNTKTFSNSKKNKKLSQEFFKENKNININNIKNLNKKQNKNPKALFINNDNHIESINIINNNINYKNIILQNLPSQNKQFNLNGKESSRNRKNTKTEKNILYDYNNNINNFQTIIPRKPKSLNKNNNLKLMLNRLDNESNNNVNLNDFEVRFKLKLYEKNNIISKLKDELEYYKSYYHSMNPMSTKNAIMPNHNTINATDNLYSNTIKRLSLGLEEQNKIIKTENMRNKIKNIFSLRKSDIKALRNGNINNLRLNIDKEGETINNSKTNKELALTIHNKSENKNRNKLIISNDILQLNKKNENNYNNVFCRSNSNTYNRKIKIGLHLSELNLDDNKFNSIEANRNHIVYNINKKNSFYKGLNKDITNRDANENENNNFNYIEKFENLKNRMNNLVTNLFDLLEKNKNN